MALDSNMQEEESTRTVRRRSVLGLMGGILTASAFTMTASAESELTQVTFDSPPGIMSPSSQIAPDDGFASTGWLTELPVDVVTVTNLNREGKGSFTDAMTRDINGEARVIVFEVGGVIDLEGNSLDPETDNMFIAGQTAPDPGITLIRGGFEFDGTNNFVQHIRVRSGTDIASSNEGEGKAADSIVIQDESEDVVLDHCTASWGTDENMSCGDTCNEITFSNSLIAEGLAKPDIHPDEGEHSNGTLIGHDTTRMAILGNLYANSNDRHPRLKGGTRTAVINNVVYNFDTAIRLGDDAETNADDEFPTQASIVGNVYRPDENTREDPIVAINDEDDVRSVKVFLDDNVMQGPLSMLADEPDPRLAVVDKPPVWPQNRDLVDGVFGHTLKTAGARPAQRTHHDRRIIHETRSKKGSIIDSEEEVGGYPNPEPVTRSLDIPTENFGEWLDRHTRAVELHGS
jgi:pectate lyase